MSGRVAGVWRYLPSALLVATALCQIILASTVDLSPWLGGGFGMFSTTDDGVNRHLHVFTTRAGHAEEEREIPQTLTDLAQRTLVLPSPVRLRVFAQALARAYSREGQRFATLRVEVWRTTFDAERLTPRTRQLRAVVLAADGEPEYRAGDKHEYPTTLSCFQPFVPACRL
jgi:hypothetical protein